MAYTIQRKLVSIGRDYRVTNDAGEVVFDIDGKFRFARTFNIRSAAGDVLLRVREKLLTIDSTFIVKRDGAEVARVIRTTTSGARVDKFKVELHSGEKLSASGKLWPGSSIRIGGVGDISRVPHTVVHEIFRLVVGDSVDQALALAIAMSMVEMEWHRGAGGGSVTGP
jgi:uncharacterized protein YxjI